MNTEPKESSLLKFFRHSTWTSRSSAVLLALTTFGLVLVFSTLTEEYFDSFDYILSAWNLLKEPTTYFFPRNPFVIVTHTVTALCARIVGLQNELKTYQLPIFLLNIGLLITLANAFKKEFRTLPWIALISLAAWNRLFIHYAPFAMTKGFATGSKV